MKNRTKQIIIMLALVLTLLVLLASCGAGAANEKASSGGSAYQVAPAAPAPAPAEAPEMERNVSADMAAPDVSYAGKGEAVYEDGGLAGAAGNVQDGRKITFRASLSINTKTFDKDYAAINNLITEYGGYIASEEMSDYSSYGQNSGRFTWISARVPAAGYNSFLDRVSEVGSVVNKSKSSDDLTAQYYDTEARIEMLQIRKDRLMKYLVEAENAADIVEFERELSNVLYDLDYYQGNKRQMDRLVEYATVDISLTELITPETIGKDGEPLGTRASDAMRLSATGVGRFLEGFVVFMAAALPVLGVLAVIAVIIWLIFRVTRKPREKARAAREEKQARRMLNRQPVYYGQYAPPQPQTPPPAPQPQPPLQTNEHQQEQPEEPQQQTDEQPQPPQEQLNESLEEEAQKE